MLASVYIIWICSFLFFYLSYTNHTKSIMIPFLYIAFTALHVQSYISWMFTISIHEKKNSISINYAVTMKRNFGCISSFFRLFFSFFHFSLLLSLSSSSVSIVVFLVPSSIFFGAVFERKSLFISSCLPYLYTLIVYTRRQVFFIVERRWKKIYLLYTKFLLCFTFRCFFSLVSEREIWKHNFFVLCVRNSALDGLRDSSLSSFFQLYVGKKKFLYYVFSSLFSTMKHSHENVKRFRNIFFIYLLLLVFSLAP